MIAARQIFLGRGGAKLPYDAVVEYLESTGTQWIYTGYFPNGINFGYTADVLFYNDLYGTRTIFGCWGPGFDTNGWCFSMGGNYRSGFGNSNSNWRGGDGNCMSARIIVGERGRVSIRNLGYSDAHSAYEMQVKSPLVNDTFFFENVYTGHPTNAITIFGTANSGGDNRGTEIPHCRIYGLAFYENDTIVMDFIPVRFTNELGQSEGAMYDRVSGTLFRNQGTGAFLYGGDVYSVPVETSQYVQDGLIAMWDGKENAGVGKRCDTATSWVDCIGSLAASVPQCRWLANSVRTDFQGQITFPNISAMTPTDFTYEIVIQMQGASSNDHRLFCSTVSSVNSPFINEPNTTTFQGVARAGSDASRNFTGDSAYLPHSFSFATDSNGVSLYTDGSFYRSGSTRPNVADSYQCPRTYDISALDAELAAFRIYSRALTAEEIAHNYARDKQRFNLP